MAGQKTWLVDFDETLASSNITWAFQDTFPRFFRKHHLDADTTRLHEVMFVLQERASQNPDPASLLEELFDLMNWPHELAQSLLDDLFLNHQPALFDDALPFLERIQEKEERILIVSNNPRTPQHVLQLNIERFCQRVLTPQICPDTRPKPHRSLWDYIATHESDIDPQSTIVVGDDPWSDGTFAEVCGLVCWLVDRMGRFSELYSKKPYRWVRSLSEIQI